MYDVSYAHARFGLGAPFSLFSSDPELCSTACLRTAGCLGWGYTDPNCGSASNSDGSTAVASGPNATCYLLTDFRHANTYNSGCRRVSGWMTGWGNSLTPRPE